MKLNKCFKEFGDLHGEILELLTEEEQIPTTQVYENLHTKVELIRETVQKWMIDAFRRINKERSLLNRAQKQRALKLHMHQPLAQEKELSNVEAAKKEAERARLRAEFAAAIKEDEERDLGSDHPGDDDPECFHWPELHGLHPQETFVKERYTSPRAHDEKLLKHPNAPIFNCTKTKSYLESKGTIIYLASHSLAARNC